MPPLAPPVRKKSPLQAAVAGKPTAPDRFAPAPRHGYPLTMERSTAKQPAPDPYAPAPNHGYASPLATAVTGQQSDFQPRQQPNAPALLPPPPKFPEKRTINPDDIDKPTPAGIYADKVRSTGLMTNDQAGDFHDQNVDPILGTRHMPKTTVGGAWGQRPSAEGQAQQAAGPAGGYTSPRLSLMDVMNRRDPTSDAAAGQATTAKLMENPDGRWFQGAKINPNQEQYPGRSTFIDPARPAPTASDRQLADSRFDFAADRAVAEKPHLSRTLRGAIAGTPNPAFAPPTAEQLAANREDYQARQALTQAERQGKVAENAGQRQDARRVRMGDLNTDERLAFADPRGAMMGKVAQGQADAKAGELKQQGELAREEMKLREALGMGNIDVAKGANEARSRAGEQEVAGNVLGAIPQLVDSGALTPEQGQQAAAQAMQQLQGGESPLQQAVAGNSPKTFESLPKQDRRKLAELPPEERRQYLIGLGITDANVRSDILSAAAGSPYVTDDNPDGYNASDFFHTVFGGDFVDDARRGFKNRKGQREFPTLPTTAGVLQRIIGGS